MEPRQSPGEKPPEPSKTSAFTPKERKAYFKRKWRREHIPLLAVLAAILAAALVAPWIAGRPWLTVFAPLVALVEYGYQNNRMMAYVERCLYG